MMRLTQLTVLSLVLTAAACGPKAFTKGEYDDPTRVELLDDKFNEADMQQMADTIVKSLVACKYVSNAPKPPVVAVERVENRTEEHIDMLSLTDKIQVALIKSGKVRFVDKPQREAIEKEIQYHEGGNVSGPTAKKRGNQTGADYLFVGNMATNIQQVGDQKYIYYKLTINMTNLETSTIDCTEEREIRKKYRKQSI
jgi:uncharacterized protein (TIGR02722 family)